MICYWAIISIETFHKTSSFFVSHCLHMCAIATDRPKQIVCCPPIGGLCANAECKTHCRLLTTTHPPPPLRTYANVRQLSRRPDSISTKMGSIRKHASVPKVNRALLCMSCRIPVQTVTMLGSYQSNNFTFHRARKMSHRASPDASNGSASTMWPKQQPDRQEPHLVRWQRRIEQGNNSQVNLIIAT